MKFIDELLKGEKVEWKKLGEIGEFYGGITGKRKEEKSSMSTKKDSFKVLMKQITGAELNSTGYYLL